MNIDSRPRAVDVARGIDAGVLAPPALVVARRFVIRRKCRRGALLSSRRAWSQAVVSVMRMSSRVSQAQDDLGLDVLFEPVADGPEVPGSRPVLIGDD